MAKQAWRLAVRLSAALLYGAIPDPTQAQELPPAIQLVTIEGVLRDGEWLWLRGHFQGASAEDVKSWNESEVWLRACARSNATSQKPVASEVTACQQAKQLANASKSYTSWEAFTEAMAKAKGVLDVYQFGVTNSVMFASYSKGWTTPEGERILRAAMRDSAFRTAMSWQGRQNSPAIDHEIMPALHAQASVLVMAEDHANTQMLKEIVSAHGWPTKSAVGALAADKAWLLAQHADLDPAFQQQVLGLMEPLVATNEVSRSNYAYLYDRVMLKLAGKQRYGTQYGPCENGFRPLRPLEQGRDLAADRAVMGLKPIEQSRADMDKTYGTCPTK